MAEPHDHDRVTRLLRLRGAPIRILIAEDHPLYAEALILTLLGDDRHEVVGHAQNGRQAVELAARLRPDVLLMDVHMPLLDGIEATRRVREILPGTQVIVLTSETSAAYREAALEAGASAYLTKTCSSQELIDAVNAAGCTVVPFRRVAGAA